jgi:hypothetical protein
MLRGESRELSGTDMPDDLHLPVPRRNPEGINLGRIQSELEFLIERVGSWIAKGFRPSQPQAGE